MASDLLPTLSLNDIWRFWQKVIRMDSGCWLWTGYRDRKGYGQFRLRGLKTQNRAWWAHRLSYYMEHGCLPRAHVDHICQNPSCVNPRHLRMLDARTNSLKRKAKRLYDGSLSSSKAPARMG